MSEEFLIKLTVGFDVGTHKFVVTICVTVRFSQHSETDAVSDSSPGWIDSRLKFCRNRK